MNENNIRFDFTAHSGHLGLLGSILSPNVSMYVPETSKHSSYFSPPALPHAQCQLFVSLGSGIFAIPKNAFVAWQTQVLNIAHDPVAANLQAAQALPFSPN